MARDWVRRSALCACGGDVFERSFDEGAAVWRCGNCGAVTARTRRARKTNHHRAILAYLAIRAEWEPIEAALTRLANAGAVTGGALLVHSSVFNHHLKQLSDLARPNNFQVRYHAAEARADMRRAEAFVTERGEGITP